MLDLINERENPVIKRLEKRAGNLPDRTLKRMKKAMEILEIKPIKILHVVGTNGKGSVSKGAFTILRDIGVNVSLYTSPHLVHYGERIQTKDGYIHFDRLIQLIERVNAIEPRIKEEYGDFTYFEILTLAAFMYFNEKNIELAVVEAGVGGRYDATKALEKGFSYIIASIGLDHKSYLGDTIQSVSYHKAGILDDGVAASLQTGEVLDIIKSEAKNYDLKLYDRDYFKFFVGDNEVDVMDLPVSGPFKMNFMGYEFNLNPSQIGKIRGENAALGVAGAIFSMNELDIDISSHIADIENSIANMVWEGRMQILKKEPLLIIDGAHNEDAFLKLKESLKCFNYNKLHMIYAVMDTKDRESQESIIKDLADFIYVTSNGDEKSVDLELLKSETGADKSFINPIDAINYALGVADKDDLILVSGSLYLVGEVLENISMLG